MPDLPRDTLSSPEPTPRRRLLTRGQRLEGAVLGAVSGGVVGWLTAWQGDVHGGFFWWVITGLAVLAAAFGYRYGRGVVKATFKAFGEAD
jgi:hypothetical protein